MSDLKRTHGFVGSICLIISLIFFILAFCYIWSIFVFPQGFIIALRKTVIISFFFGISFILAKIACTAYIGLSEKEICKFDRRVKKREEGVVYLASAFFVVAVATNLTLIFLVTPIPFFIFILVDLFSLSFFIEYVIYAIDTFYLIE